MNGAKKPDETHLGQTRKLWQEQPLEGMTMSLKEVHERIKKLSGQVRRRNLIGGFACVTVFLGFTYFSVYAYNTMERIGAALTALGAAYIMGQLVLGKMKIGAARLQAQAESVAFYRSELERQRDFHRGSWLWSRLLVFAPGPFVFCLGVANAVPTQARYLWIEAAVAAALLIVSIPRNLRLARRYQRELDMLNSANN
jgi:Flp pilus assembly protein TadB